MSDSGNSILLDAEGRAGNQVAAGRSLCAARFQSHRGRWAALICRLAMVLLPEAAFANTLPVGFITWDITDPGVSGQFDIVNQTGPNSSGDATWPVTTPVALSSLTLTVHFTDSSTSHFGASYFTLSADGLSFDGGVIPIGAGHPQPTDATLTGSLSPLAITLFDGSKVDISPAFAASIPFHAGGLSDGDLQIMAATSVATSVPEPSTLMLLASCIVVVFLSLRSGQIFVRRRRSLCSRCSVIACMRNEMKRTVEGSKVARSTRLISLVFAFLLSFGTASATVKLNLWTAPDSGVAGNSFVNVTGSGFPTTNGTIAPGDVSVSLSLACGGSVVAATPASSVKQVIGSSYRIQFKLPASLSTGNYFVSVSGTTADRTPFSSGNCSEIAVTASTASNVLISRAWTLPAETEAFKCRAIQVQTDTYITGFHPILSAGDFHMVLTVSDLPVPLGDYDCSAGSLGGKGFYASGSGANDLTFPPGVAVHLKAGQFINMNLHVVNLTASDVTGLAGVAVQTTSATAVTDEAEMIFGGTFNIKVPPDGQTHFASGGCNAPQDYHVVALWPHMHDFGTRIKLVHTHAGVPQTLLDIPYTDKSQLIYPLTPPAIVQQSDQMQVTCSFVNNTDHTVTFGDSVSAEQCFMGIYRYPVLPGNTLFYCAF